MLDRRESIIKKQALGVLAVFLVLLVTFTGCSEDDKPGKVDAEIGVSALASLADSRIEDYVNCMKALAMTQEVQSGDWEQMVGLLTEVEEAQIPGVDWFVMPDGNYYTVDLGLTGKNLSDRAYFPGLMAGNEVLGDLVISKSTGKKALIAAVPVVKDGVVIGGLGVSIFLDGLSEILANDLQLPSDMVFYAVTDDGEVALHSDTALILEEGPDLSEDVVTVTSQLIGWDFSLGFK